MTRLASALFVGGGALLVLAGAGMLAQSNRPADLSKEWPTYGHDSGGMRFSPATQLTPANVSQLKVAWVYHMRPPGAPTTAAPAPPPAEGRGAGRGAVGDTPEEGAAPTGGRRGGRFGSGMRPSEATPLVIDGVM